MADNILDQLGIDEKIYEESKGSTVTASFEALPSGVYPGTVKDIVLFKSVFEKDGQKTESTQMRITIDVLAKDEDGKEKKVAVAFQKDIGKTLKDGAVNEGFVARLKSLSLATNVDIKKLTMGGETKVNSFGKDCDGTFLNGMNDKPVVALVKLMRDENKSEGEAYRDQNFLEGVCAKDSEDIKKFEEKIEKQKDGVFLYKGYTKTGGSKGKTTEASNENKEKLKEYNF